MIISEPAISIGSRTISAGNPCYVIAEIGVNHDGDVTLAHKMVDEAKATGADAVKFQTFRADAVISEGAAKAAYQKRTTGDGDQLEMIRDLELSFDDFARLKEHCDTIGIDFISTAFDVESLDFIIGLNPPCLKWPSGEITNLAMLRHAVGSRLPLLISTGMATLADIDRAVTIAREFSDELAILQCVSNYPARIEDQNLRTLPALSAAFSCPVGFSDHTLGRIAAFAARALGMAILEKHFTLDRSRPGPDHSASMEPQDFKGLVEELRILEVGLGDGVKRPMKDEEDTRLVARRSLVYARALPAGHVLAETDLTAKRPADGVGPEHIELVLGMRLKNDVGSGQRLGFADLAEG